MRNSFLGLGLILLASTLVAKPPPPKPVYSKVPHTVGTEVPIRVAAGKAMVYDHGGLASGVLAEDHSLKRADDLPEFQLTAGTFVELDYGNRLQGFVPLTDSTYLGLPLAGGHKAVLTYAPWGGGHSFRVALSKPMVINDFPVAAGAHFMVNCKTGCASLPYAETRLVFATAAKEVVTESGNILPKGLRYSFDKNGLRQVKITEKLSIQGMVASPQREVDLYPSGMVKQIMAGAEFEVDGITFLENNYVSLTAEGRLSGGVAGRGAYIRGVPIHSSYWFHLHPNGEVKHATLARSIRRGDLRIPERTSINQREDRSIENLRLHRESESMIVGDIILSPGSGASFDADGNVTALDLAKPTLIDGMILHRQVRFHANGEVKFANLPQAQRIQGFEVAPKAVQFYKTGRLEYFWVEGEKMIQGLLVKGTSWDQRVILHENGRLKRTFLAEPSIIDGIPAAVGSLSLFDNGKVQSCRIAHDVTINGVDYKAGDYFRARP